nr:retrovirus-related Pol polyprotein from transposon TNT 1-94 [Tanacetum cinerariifolium]
MVSIEAFMKFKAMVEKEKGLKIKSMRSDRGGEFLSKEFNKFCDNNRIRRFLTAPYSSQQNGVVERKNRTILNMVRIMLKSKKMPKEFWAKAVDCAVYLLNWYPSKSLDNKTSQEAWNGLKPTVSHLPSKGYKLYNPVTRKVVVSRDVEFNEEGSWDWSIEENEIYEFLPMTDEEKTGEPGDEVQQPESPTPTQDSPLISSEREPKKRSLQELYEKWRQAMEEEIKSIEKNDTWELTTLLKGQKAIGVKWVYKAKKNAKGEVEKYKARLVAKGYKQKHGIDYEEVFSLVARLETIRMIIDIAAQYRWKIHQMVVKSVFLNGLLEEGVYVEQPEGYVTKGQEGKVLRLKKALYGLKQAPRAWNTRIDNYFQEHDLLKKSMTREFEMTDIGLMSYYLGIKVKQTDKGIFICQERYDKEILKSGGLNSIQESRWKFALFDMYKSRHPFCGWIDWSFYGRAYDKHLKIAKRIIRYIKGTVDYGMLYSTSIDFKLVGYSDSDWAGSKDDGRSTSGFLFFLGNNALTWSSKKQPIVTLSSCEAEYIAATSCVCHAIWLRSILKELQMEQEDATEIYVDNKSAIDLAKNPVYHDRSKHINTRYHFIQECVARKDVQVIHTSFEDQVVNIFIKPLNERDFTRQRIMFGVKKSSLKGGVGS